MKTHPAKDHRLMFGLVALLFAVTFVHTAAILKMESKIKSSPKSQAAQVTAASFTCLQVTPVNNRNKTLSTTPTLSEYVFEIVLKIKNRCSQPIKVVNPASINSHVVPLPSLSFSKLQMMDGFYVPVDVPIPNPQQINAQVEVMLCNDCVNPPTTHPFPSGVNGDITGAPLSGGETREFSFIVAVKVPNPNAIMLRALPKAVGWFYDSALTNGIVDAVELKTHTFSTQASLAAGTDLLQIVQ
jgi:hypothetical protein